MTKDGSNTDILWLQRLVLVVFCLMILRFMLPPNGFAATILLFDYEVGLIRRGLLGTIGNLFWGESVSKSEIFGTAAAISLFGTCAVLAVIRRWLWTSQAGLLLALIFVGSFAFGAIVGSTGYLDLVLIGITAVALQTDPTRAFGLYLRTVVAALGVFFHEIMLPCFAVLMSVELWLNRRGLARAGAPAPLGAALLTLLLVMIMGVPNTQDIARFETHIAAKAEFSVTAPDAPDAPVDPEAIAVVGRGLDNNMDLMATERKNAAYRVWILFDGLPLLAFALWLLWLNLRVLGRGPKLDRLAVVGAISAPLTLNLIAYDVVRFGALSCLVGLLLLVAHIRRSEAAALRLAEILNWRMAVGVIVLNQFVIVTQLSVGNAHTGALPWVILTQLRWFG